MRVVGEVAALREEIERFEERESVGSAGRS